MSDTGILFEILPLQDNWRWCHKCQGLFFGGNSGSVCPADNAAHSDTQGNTGQLVSGDYALFQDLPADQTGGQSNWRWCNKCQGLFFGGNPGSVCPADHHEHHDPNAGPRFYTLFRTTDTPSPGTGGTPQANWRWCGRCQGLWFAGNINTQVSHCPAGGAHIAVKSGDYVLQILPPPDPNPLPVLR